MYSIDRLGVL